MNPKDTNTHKRISQEVVRHFGDVEFKHSPSLSGGVPSSSTLVSKNGLEITIETYDDGMGEFATVFLPDHPEQQSESYSEDISSQNNIDHLVARVVKDAETFSFS